MSKYTTEVRYICENYAGLDESVGLSRIDEVLDEATPKVFDFSYPIFEEAYRRPLERKILSHYYTREIGYETVGRWKLALRNKMNEIMPYYNQLYKAAGQFGRLNLFDDVDVSESHVGSGTSVGSKTTERSGNTTDTFAERSSVNENGNDNRSRITNDTETENTQDRRNLTGTDGGTVETVFSGQDERSKNESIIKNDTQKRDGTRGGNESTTDNVTDNTTENGSTHTIFAGQGERSKKESDIKTENENRDITKTANGSVTDSVNEQGTTNNTVNETGSNVKSTSGSKSNTAIGDNWKETEGTESGTFNGNKNEKLTSSNETSSVNTGNSESVKRRLYSDTPQGAIDFSNDGSALGAGVGVGGDGADSLYVTNLTKDIGADKNSGSSTGSSSGESENTVTQNDRTNSSVNSFEKSGASNIVKENNEGEENDRYTKNGTGEESVSKTKSGESQSNNTENVGEEFNARGSRIGSVDETEKTDNDETVTKQGTVGKTVEGNGSKEFEETNAETVVGNSSHVASVGEVDKSDKNETVTKSLNKNENVEGSGSRDSKKYGSDVTNGDYNKNSSSNVSHDKTSNKIDNENENNSINTTENFVNSIKGKRGNMTYSAMFIELQKALVNIDMMVIEELGTLFMGLWE